jgi:hypothetical protein
MKSKRLLAMITTVLLTGCAEIYMNDGNTVVVEQGGWMRPEDVAPTAVKVCREQGNTGATFITSTSRYPDLPGTLVRRLFTFKCT